MGDSPTHHADDPSDRRTEGRAAITLRVDYKRLNTFFADYTKNISKGGTFIRTTKPLGVLAAHRLHHLQLQVPVEVGPRPLEVVWHPEAAPVAVGGHPHTADGATGELVRSVRPYVPGDAPRLVHWATTARVGQLVVRELEPPVPIGQAIVVDLRDLGTRTEQAASYAAGACRAVLDRGGALVLSTCEADGPVTAPVRTPVEVGRRLARAVAGPPGNPPSRWPLVEIGR